MMKKTPKQLVNEIVEIYDKYHAGRGSYGKHLSDVSDWIAEAHENGYPKGK